MEVSVLRTLGLRNAVAFVVLLRTSKNDSRLRLCYMVVAPFVALLPDRMAKMVG
jgi:hypothetical protein